MIFTEDNFEEEVIQSELPVLVDMYADWCGPCRLMAPVIDELEEAYAGRVKIGQLDVDENPDLCAEYGVMSIPAFLFFKDGELMDQAVGAMSREAMIAKLDELLEA